VFPWSKHKPREALVKEAMDWTSNDDQFGITIAI